MAVTQFTRTTPLDSCPACEKPIEIEITLSVDPDSSREDGNATDGRFVVDAKPVGAVVKHDCREVKPRPRKPKPEVVEDKPGETSNSVAASGSTTVTVPAAATKPARAPKAAAQA